MWDGMGGVGLIPMLVWIVFSVGILVLMVLAVVWLARSIGSSGDASRGASSPGGAPTSAREALDLRYARGEIGRDEYLQARRDLEDPAG